MQATAWWQRGIIYEVYPRSFQDANDDGVGDLAGILARLDYLLELGVKALWIAPIYPSPMADFGYDVADYCGIDPRFGTLADFDRLLNAVHERGLKLILGSSRAVARAKTRSAIGICGEMPLRMVDRPITGRATSAARDGSGMRRRDSITTTRS
jgi:hypothetical protein